VSYRKRRILVGEKSGNRQRKRGHRWTSSRGVLEPRLVACTPVEPLKYPSVWPKGKIHELMTL